MFKFCCEDCGESWYVGNPRTCKCPDEEPNKKWVGLTNDELVDLAIKHAGFPTLLSEAIENKLKEKNT